MNQWPMILEQLKLLIYTAPATLLALSVHEASHGLVSYWLGDPTPKEEKRISLNPLRHLDVFGTICMLLFHFGWARPVQVNPRYYRHPKTGMALTALAGPVSNFLLAFLAIGLYVLCVRSGWHDAEGIRGYLELLVEYIAILNVGLGVFNLIPIPPLDGSKVLGALLPDRLYYAFLRIERLGGILLLVVLYTGILSEPMNVVRNWILNLFLSVWA